MPTKPLDLEVHAFPTQPEWRAWLMKRAKHSPGIWLRLYKKDSNISSITYAEALDEALCFGWIDGQKRSYDDNSWVQRFTPRRPKSIWSKRNVEHITRLTKAGKMQPAGLAQVEAAKADGRFAQAYDSSASLEIPTDFLEELAKDKKAEAFFKTLNKANVYAIGWRLQTAKKPETRQKRMNTMLEMLKNGQKFH